MNIDFKKDFKFIAKPDEYYLELTEVVIEDDFSEWRPIAYTPSYEILFTLFPKSKFLVRDTFCGPEGS